MALPFSLFEFNYHAAQLVEKIEAAGAVVEIVGSEEKQVIETTRPSVVTPHSNIWIRDYGPIPVTEDGKVSFRGLVPNSPDPENNFFGEQLARKLAVPYLTAKIELDGGNFLTDGRKCYIAGPLEGSEINTAGLPTVTEMQNRLGCIDLIVITRPPHVHIDMFAKILGPDLVAVNVLDQTVLDFYRDPEGALPEELNELNDALNRSAQQFSQHLKVVRLPMPAPYKNTFRTYANAILVNGTAIIPDYELYGWNYGPYPDADLLPELKVKVAAVYHQAGFKPVFVNADGLIYNGGAFHCVSLHFPRSTLVVSQN